MVMQVRGMDLAVLNQYMAYQVEYEVVERKGRGDSVRLPLSVCVTHVVMKPTGRLGV